MAAKAKNLYLYLALACFLGIVAIFVGDGYMGVHDTIYITAGEQEQVIEDDTWLQDYDIAAASAGWGEKVFFRYEVDNRLFSDYSAHIEVSLWHSQQKVLDILSQQLEIAAFAKGQVEFTVDTAELPAPEQFAEYTVIIKRGQLERRIILFLDERSPSKFPIPAR